MALKRAFFAVFCSGLQIDKEVTPPYGEAKEENI